MEETELEEGETFNYEKDDDSTIDPDVALSYIDEKLQDVLGHFQKDFEGGVTAENLGSKFGGYGSFLPTYQRSPALSHQRTPPGPEVHNYGAPKSPNIMHLEGVCHDSVDASSASLSARLGPAKDPAVNDSTKRDVCMSSTRAGESTSKFELINKSTNPSDQKILKVRIKVGSDNLSTRKNAEIYSGLGLDVSPSSSLNDSPMDSAELSCGPKDAPDESPTSILQIMTSFPLHGSLMLSPLPDDLIRFIQKEKLLGNSRYGPVRKGNQESSEISMNGSDFGRADPRVLGVNKPKPSEKYSFSVDLNHDNSNDARNGIGVLPKKETDIDTETCEELVSNALRLPPLSNSYCNVANSAGDNAREVDDSSLASNGGAKDEPFSNLAKEEPLESVSTQEHGQVEKSSGDGRVWENKKANSDDEDSVFRRKGSNLEGEKTDVPAKGESNVSEGRKTLNAEPMDPPKQKAGQKATSHEEDGMKLAPGMEQSSSGDKMKSKGSQSHGAQGAEVPKDGLKIDYSSLPESRKSTHVDSYVSKSDAEIFKKDYGKARDRYRDFFGDLELEQGYNEKDSEEMPYPVRLKDPAVIEKSTFEFNRASKERLNVRKIQKPSSSKAYPKVASSLAPFPGNGPISNASLTVAPLVNEDWVCCDKCQKWRLLPLGTNPDSLPEKWLCSMLYWLPEMNRCSISEDETTKAVIALSQVPAPESQCRQHGDSGGILSEVYSANARNCYQNHQDLGLHAASSGRKKKCGLKDVSNETNQDGPTQFSNIMNKNLQVSVMSQSLNGVNQSPVNEVDFQCSGQYSTLVAEKPRHKGRQKEKNKLLESYSGGDDTHNSKKINKRGIDQDCFRAAKKVKADGMSMNVSGKDQRKYSDRLEDSKHDSKISVRNPKDQIQITSDDGLLHIAKCDDNDAVKKRKGNEFQETHNYTVPLINAGHHLQDCGHFMEETSENDHSKEKKARVSKSGGKETCTSKGSDGTATSSSSKVSGSHKNKANLQEVKGSPVESVSSSPLRFLNPDKLTLTRRNLGGRDDFQDAGFLATASPRKCSDGEDDRGCNRSETGRKDGTFTVTHRGSLASSALDFHDRNLGHLSGSKDKAEIVPSPEFATRHATDGDADTLGEGASSPCKPQTSDQCRNEEKGNNNQYQANGSRPRKSRKGSSSRSKDKSRYLTSESDKGNRKLSDSFNESIAHTPHEKKSKAGKNKLHDKFAINSHKVENNLGPEEGTTGKLTSECSKKERLSKFGRHNGSDVVVDTVSSQDPKQNLQLEHDGEQSSKRFHSEKTDGVDVSVRGKSYSLPPSGRGRNETLRCPQPILRSQKENGANILSVCVSEGDDALKALKQIKKIENPNGNKPINSEHPTPNGQKVRDLDAASPVQRDSSSQAATNAVKEAKNLKHLADRLKNSGSSSESTGLYFQAALKFLHGASLLESCNGENNKHGEMIQSIQMYSSTAKLCDFCAHEYEKSKDMAAASLAYKCMEVAYLRVIYSSHISANRDRHELQTALQIVPTGESPSSSASDVDNLNNLATVDKVALHKSISSPQVAGNHVIAARNRSNFVRMLNFAQNVNFAMEASRKARIAFAAAKPKLEESKYKEGTSSVKRALDFDFQDVEGLLRLVRLAMEAISR